MKRLYSYFLLPTSDVLTRSGTAITWENFPKLKETNRDRNCLKSIFFGLSRFCRTRGNRCIRVMDITKTNIGLFYRVIDPIFPEIFPSPYFWTTPKNGFVRRFVSHQTWLVLDFLSCHVLLEGLEIPLPLDNKVSSTTSSCRQNSYAIINIYFVLLRFCKFWLKIAIEVW